MNLRSTSKNNSLILLFFGIFIGVLLLKWQSSLVPEISYADGVSYISATGNQGLYEHNTLIEKWVDASQWKALWNELSFFQFDQIRHDIAYYDIHPPLYFWILHIWSYMVGVELSTGPQLNIFFHVITALIIFIICRRLRCSYLTAAAAGLFWLLNSSIVTAAHETRQYSLLALFSVLFIWSLLYYFQKKSMHALLYITLASIFGMLTHYHFALLLGVSIIYFSINLLSKNKLIYLLKFFVALGIAGLGFLVIHPEFYVSFERQVFQAQVFSVENIIPRALNCRNTLIDLFKPKVPIVFLQKLALFIGLVGVIIFGINYILKKKEKIRSLKNFFRNNEFLPLFTALTITCISFALYIFQYSPLHAMNVKYMMLVTPIYFIIIGQFFNLAIPKKLMPYCIVLLLIIQSLDTTLNIRRYEKQSIKIKQSIPEAIVAGIPIILDGTGRGALPRILWHVDDNTNVYAAPQSNLIANFPELLMRPTILYVSNLEYHGNTIENQNIILEKFHKEGYELKGKVKYLFNSKIYHLIKYE